MWFQYQAPCDGTLIVSTCGSADFDTEIMVYEGNDCFALPFLDCNDDASGCPGFTSELGVPVGAGQQYLIRVGGSQNGDQGTGDLNVFCIPTVGASFHHIPTFFLKLLCVQKVTFENHFDVARDPTGTDYGTPHWQDNDLDCDASDCNEHRFPVAYERNTKVKIDEVRILSTQRAKKVVVRGTGPDGDLFLGPGRFVGFTIVANDLESGDPLPNTVKFYNTYDIVWEVSLDDGPFCPAGTTDNRLYVTLDTPTAAPLYESSCELSCSAADGESTAAAVVADVWGQFTDRDVRRKPLDGFNKLDGVRMGYWRPSPGVCQNLAAMLASPIGNGACGAWADFLISCIEVHGIAGTAFTEITADAAVNAGADGFLVKNWAFSEKAVQNGGNGVNNSTLMGDDVAVMAMGKGFPNVRCIAPGPDGKIDSVPGGDDVKIGDEEINTGPDGVCNTAKVGDDIPVIAVGSGDANRVCILAGPNGVIDSTVAGGDGVTCNAVGGGLYPYTFDTNAIDLPGVAGQDNPDPPRAFFNHFVVRYIGMIYDPSYGTGPLGELAHENASIDGIFDEGLPDTCKKNAAAQELDYCP